MMQSAFRMVLAALLLACLSGFAGASEGAGLFSAHRPNEAAVPLPRIRGLLGEAAVNAGELELRGGGPALGGAAPSAELRSRVAEVDLGQLESARLGVEGHRQARLGLNLFADAAFEAVFERSAPTASGYTLTGRLADDPMSTVALAVNGEWVAGTVWSPHGRYVIRPLGGGVASVRQLDPSRLGHCGVGADSVEGLTGPSLPEAERPSLRHAPDAVASDESAPVSEAFPEDDGSLIDLLVVYPSFARRLVGGHRAMRALIDSDVALTNEAYRIGGVAQQLNLVAAVEARRTALERITDGIYKAHQHVIDQSSGYMDEVLDLRDSYAADLVLVHWGHERDNRIAGVGDLLTSPQKPPWTPFGISISNSFAFAHELGHNMGLRHQRADDPGNTPFPYSHGFEVVDSFATIMATGRPYLRVPRFSNPRQRHLDKSDIPIQMGVPGDDPTDSADGPADAVRSLNGTRRLVANFRRSASRCSYELKEPADAPPASGGEFRIQVQADSRCAWTAFSNDRFVSIADGSNGVGDGEVVFQVSANEGWERDLAVFVAGEAYLAEQATAKTRRETPVCDRTAFIRGTLVNAVLGYGSGSSAEDCWQIDAEDLAAIRTLASRHFPRGLEPDERRLAPGDFDGLTGLVSLDLSSTGLTSLAPGTFDGLTRLLSLDLRGSTHDSRLTKSSDYNYGLTELAAGTFEGLPNLMELKLAHNRSLTTLKSGAFRGLSNLHKLEFGGTGLTALAAGTFEGLSNLFSLDFGAVFDASASGAGCGHPPPILSSCVPLAQIAPGAFRGLFKLEELHFNFNSLKSLPPGVFDGLPNLRILSVTDNDGLTALDPGVFDGLSKLARLNLRSNSLRSLPPGVFDELPSLRQLLLDGNSLRSLPPGVFDGLAGLWGVYLSNNQLTTLEPGVFDGLAELESVQVSDNKLKTLKRGLFDGLTALRAVLAKRNKLTDLDPALFQGTLNQYGYSQMSSLQLEGNRLATLPPDLFGNQMPSGRQMPHMRLLGLGDNLLNDLDPRLLRDLPNLEYLMLRGNRFAKLRPGLFEGLDNLGRLDLSGNPGAPFDISPEFVRLPGEGTGSGRAVEFALQVAEGAPFDMRMALSASGGALSAEEIMIRRGAVRGPAFSVAPRGDGPVTLTATTPQPSSCRLESFWLASYSTPCMNGLKRLRTAPLILYGLPDQTLAPDGAFRFDLPTSFPTFFEGTSYRVESSNPTAVAVSIREGLLIVSAAGGGETILTVTATSPYGRRETRRFAVTALASPEAIERIPDLSLMADESVRIDLSGKFRDPDGGSLSYAAETSDSAVATATMEGSALIVVGRAPGAATVTLTATDPDGLSAALSFRARVPAPPEVVERIPDLSLASGESVRIELSGKFRDPDGGSLSYAAETSDSAVVTASVDGGALIVAGQASGAETLTLTATDPDGLSAALSFKVKVRPLRSRWGGWRSALLKPSSSEGGDEL